MDTLKSLTTKQAKYLQAKGYTLESLATASVSEIATLAGLNLRTAQAAIKEARQVVNAAKLEESRYSAPAQADEAQMSVRVRRIAEQND